MTYLAQKPVRNLTHGQENFYKLLSKFLSRPDKILKASESNNLEEFLDTYFSL